MSFPLAGKARDGWSKDGEATATCFCGAVQLVAAVDGPEYVGSFICNCADCHKLTASMFASNFVTTDKGLRYVRGFDKLTQYSQNVTIATGDTMTDFFCSICGTLLNRVSSGYPGMNILRIGTVDDFSLMETKLKPQHEQFVRQRMSWLSGGKGVEQHKGNFYVGAGKTPPED